MIDQEPTACMVAGDISASDYITISKRFTLRPPSMKIPGLIGFLLGIGLSFIAITFIQACCPASERAKVVAIVFPILIAWIAILFVFLKVFVRMNRTYYQINAVVPNVGPCTYTIIGSELHFSGTMWSCIVPIPGIQEIAQYDGVTLLVFSNATSFFIPRIITSGDLQEFLSQLRGRIPSLQA